MAKRKVQKDKQRSTKHAHKTTDRVTRTLLKPGVNSDAPEGNSSCSTSGARRYSSYKLFPLPYSCSVYTYYN